MAAARIEPAPAYAVSLRHTALAHRHEYDVEDGDGENTVYRLPVADIGAIFAFVVWHLFHGILKVFGCRDIFFI